MKRGESIDWAAVVPAGSDLQFFANLADAPSITIKLESETQWKCIDVAQALKSAFTTEEEAKCMKVYIAAHTAAIVAAGGYNTFNRSVKLQPPTRDAVTDTQLLAMLPPFLKKTKVVVLTRQPVTAAMSFPQHERVALLLFRQSSREVGCGWQVGERSAEDDMFRRSTISAAFSPQQQQQSTTATAWDSPILIRNVSAFRGIEFEGCPLLPLPKIFDTVIATLPTPENEKGHFEFGSKGATLTLLGRSRAAKRMASALAAVAALENTPSTVVIDTFSCIAEENDKEEYFHELAFLLAAVLPLFAGFFERIELAVSGTKQNAQYNLFESILPKYLHVRSKDPMADLKCLLKDGVCQKGAECPKRDDSEAPCGFHFATPCAKQLQCEDLSSLHRFVYIHEKKRQKDHHIKEWQNKSQLQCLGAFYSNTYKHVVDGSTLARPFILAPQLHRYGLSPHTHLLLLSASSTAVSDVQNELCVDMKCGCDPKTLTLLLSVIENATLIRGHEQPADRRKIERENLENIAASMDVEDAVKVAATAIACGYAFNLSALEHVKGTICRTVDKWNYSTALLCACWARENIATVARLSATRRSTPQPLPLLFPERIPSALSFYAVATLAAMVFTLSEGQLPPQSSRGLAYWLHQAIAWCQGKPLCPIPCFALLHLSMCHPELIGTLYSQGNRFCDVVAACVLRGLLASFTPGHRDFSLEAFLKMARVFLKLALVNIQFICSSYSQTKASASTSNELQGVVVEVAVKLARLHTAAKAASDDIIAPLSHESLRLILSCIDVLFHNYSAPPPECLLSGLRRQKYVFTSLDEAGIEIQLTETILAGIETATTMAEQHSLETLAGLIPASAEQAQLGVAGNKGGCPLAERIWAADLLIEMMEREWWAARGRGFHKVEDEENVFPFILPREESEYSQLL